MALRGVSDPEILEQSAVANRVLMSHDRRTKLNHFRNRLAAGKSSRGLRARVPGRALTATNGCRRTCKSASRCLPARWPSGPRLSKDRPRQTGHKPWWARHRSVSTSCRRRRIVRARITSHFRAAPVRRRGAASPCGAGFSLASACGGALARLPQSSCQPVQRD